MMERTITGYDESNNYLFEIDNLKTVHERELTDKVSLIDKWLEDPKFASGGKRVEQMPSVTEPDKQIWYNKWSPGQLTVSSIHLEKKKCQDNEPTGNGHASENDFQLQELKEHTKCIRRERNKRFAKESRDRKKQNGLNEQQNFQDLSEEKYKLVEDIEKLKIEVEDLVKVKDSLIHEECCSHGNDVYINDPDATENVHNIPCGSNIAVLNDNGQRVIHITQQQQEQQPIQQEVAMQTSSSPMGLSTNVMQSGSPVFMQNGTSFPFVSRTFGNSLLQNQYLSPTQSANFGVNNNKSFALENDNGQPNGINTGGFFQTLDNIPHCSQASSLDSPWYVGENHVHDKEYQSLKNSFTKN